MEIIIPKEKKTPMQAGDLKPGEIVKLAGDRHWIITNERMNAGGIEWIKCVSLESGSVDRIGSSLEITGPADLVLTTRHNLKSTPTA
jgi:hypothetical protein